MQRVHKFRCDKRYIDVQQALEFACLAVHNQTVKNVADVRREPTRLTPAWSQ